MDWVIIVFDVSFDRQPLARLYAWCGDGPFVRAVREHIGKPLRQDIDAAAMRGDEC